MRASRADRDSSPHGQWATGGPCAGALALRAAGQRPGQGPAGQRPADVSLTAAHSAAGSPNAAPATATQNRGERGAATRAVSETHPDSRADGAPKSAGGYGLE